MGELVFLIVVLGIPLALVIRCWHYYAEVGAAPAVGPAMVMSLALISASMAMWIGAVGLMVFQDHSAAVKALAVKTSPADIGLVNIAVCVGAIICSRIRRKPNGPVRKLRKTVAAASGFLVAVWLMLALDVH